MKRGMAATVKDLMMSAEYVLSQGNPGVVLCERGVKGFDNACRNMFDIAAVPQVNELSHLPIIVDPSHATGRPELIPACALAGVAAGADGVHIEVHNKPRGRDVRRPAGAAPRAVRRGGGSDQEGRRGDRKADLVRVSVVSGPLQLFRNEPRTTDEGPRSMQCDER